MSWFGKGKKKDPVKSAAEPTGVRQRQIEGLLQCNTGCTLVAPDTYELQVTTQFGPLPFRIFLPPLFPSCGPVIRMEKGCQHKWIDGRVSLGHSLIGVFACGVQIEMSIC